MLVGAANRSTVEPCITAGQNNLSAPCDHNGVRWANPLTQPTNVIYRWLVADPQNPGALIPFATPVTIQQPTITIVPPVQPAQPPVVVFQIQMPPPPPPKIRPPQPQFGEAKWVKVFKTELPRQVGLGELQTDNPVVPNDDASTETPWKLLQFNPHSASSGVLTNQGGLGSGSHSVIRRYEYYKYTGTYDPLTHQATCGGTGECLAPLDGELGDYIGAQMAAANVGVPSLTVNKIGTGTVTGGKINCGGSCTEQVAAGTVVTLTANPGGSVFTGWTGACVGTTPTCVVTVNDETSVTASFSSQFTLSIGRAGSGTITGVPGGNAGTSINCGGNCSAKFTQGTAVTLTATPSGTAHFINWTGACSGTAPTCTVVIGKTSKWGLFSNNSTLINISTVRGIIFGPWFFPFGRSSRQQPNLDTREFCR